MNLLNDDNETSTYSLSPSVQYTIEDDDNTLPIPPDFYHPEHTPAPITTSFHELDMNIVILVIVLVSGLITIPIYIYIRKTYLHEVRMFDHREYQSLTLDSSHSTTSTKSQEDEHIQMNTMFLQTFNRDIKDSSRIELESQK